MIDIMTKYLEFLEHSVITDPTLTDKPDWVFDLDGNRIGAELTCLTVERVIKWSRTTKPKNLTKPTAVTYFLEPHWWVRKAIEAKRNQANLYRQRASTETAWLVVHSEFEWPFAFFPLDEFTLELMRKGAASTHSDFDEIWFAHATDGVRRLWRKGDSTCNFPDIPITLKGHPTYTIAQGTLDTSKSTQIDLGPSNRKSSVMIPPIDPRTRHLFFRSSKFDKSGSDADK